MQWHQQYTYVSLFCLKHHVVCFLCSFLTVTCALVSCGQIMQLKHGLIGLTFIKRIKSESRSKSRAYDLSLYIYFFFTGLGNLIASISSLAEVTSSVLANITFTIKTAPQQSAISKHASHTNKYRHIGSIRVLPKHPHRPDFTLLTQPPAVLQELH